MRVIDVNVLMCNKFHWPRGGSEAVYFDNIRMLEAHGHRVATFAMADERNLPSQWSRFFVSNVDYNVRRGSRLGSALGRIREAANVIWHREARRNMDALLDEFTPDIAHVHNIYHQISPSILYPIKKRGIPVVMTLHDYKLVCPNHTLFVHERVCELCGRGRFYHSALHRCVKDSFFHSALCALEMYLHVHGGLYRRGVDRFISPSEFLRKLMIRAGWPEESVVTIHNTLDPSLYEPSYEPGDYFAYVGRLDLEKGVLTLLRAVEMAGNVRLVVVGDGFVEDEMREFVADRHLSGVEFRGRLNPKDVSAVLRGALALVLPSEWYENCPVSVLEAFAHGKPAIGARIGGIPELIQDGSDGLLFESGNAEQLAALMKELWQARDRAREMGIRARRKLEDELSSERYYESLIHTYRGLVPAWIEPE